MYDARLWVGLNVGVFLIRNCRWSLDFMDLIASSSSKVALLAVDIAVAVDVVAFGAYKLRHLKPQIRGDS